MLSLFFDFAQFAMLENLSIISDLALSGEKGLNKVERMFSSQQQSASSSQLYCLQSFLQHSATNLCDMFVTSCVAAEKDKMHEKIA